MFCRFANLVGATDLSQLLHTLAVTEVTERAQCRRHVLVHGLDHLARLQVRVSDLRHQRQQAEVRFLLMEMAERASGNPKTIGIVMDNTAASVAL